MISAPCPTRSGPHRCSSTGEHSECEAVAPEYAIGRHAGVEIQAGTRLAAIAAVRRIQCAAMRSAGLGSELEAQILADCDVLVRVVCAREETRR